MVAIECDVTDRASAQRAVDRTVARFGRLDVLVNNAGVGGRTTFAETTDEEWDRLSGVNLTGPVRCIQAALPHLLDSPVGGTVVTIGSVNGIAAFGDPAYSMLKAGLHNMVKNLTVEYGPRGLRFNVVAPVR